MLEGLVITGGEPLMYDITSFVKEVKNLGYLVKLDTNGSYPKKLKALVQEGLIDYVAMDVKNDFENYNKTVGLAKVDLEAIKESINFLLKGTVDYEFRTTIVNNFHNEKSILSLLSLIKGAKRYYLQTFVNRENVIDKSLKAPSKHDMENYLKLVKTYISNAEIRDSN